MPRGKESYYTKFIKAGPDFRNKAINKLKKAERAARTSEDGALLRRAWTMRLVLEGYEYPDIEEIMDEEGVLPLAKLSCSANLRKLFENPEGDLKDKPSRGKPKIFTPDEEEAIFLMWRDQTPADFRLPSRQWTPGDLTEAAIRTFGKHVGASTIANLIRNFRERLEP